MKAYFVGGERNGTYVKDTSLPDVIYFPDGEYKRSKFKDSEGNYLYVFESLCWF